MTVPVIEYDPVGSNGTAKVTARLGDTLIACEMLNLLKPEKRAAFAERVCVGRNIDREALEGQLMRAAAQLEAKPDPVSVADLPEIECSSFVRPELFHTPDVSGISLPVRSSIGAEARTRWMVYLRWADGRRERRELQSTIELSNGRRLWIHPMPGQQSATMTTAWSAGARRNWLTGSNAPNAADVFKRICDRIAYFVDFPPDVAAETTALMAAWIVFTYVYPAWAAVPYLSIGGPLGSGKSTLFHVLAAMIFKPLQSSNMTAACLFRTLNDHGGTLLLDEAERLKDGTPEAGELRSILLSGYKYGSPARRLEKAGDGFRHVEFNVFGPKAMASIANPPEALASRCLRIVMFRAGPDSPKPRRRIDADPATWQAIRDDLHSLALEHGPTWMQLAARADVVPMSLAGREYELWQPILSLAAFIEDAGARGLMPMMRAHAEALASDGRDDATPEADETLLRIVAQSVIDGRHFNLRPSDVLKRANEIDPQTFAKWGSRLVSAALAKYGVKTNKTRGAKVYARVELGQLRRIEAAYSLDLGLPPVNVPYVPQCTPNPILESKPAITEGT